MNAYTYFKNLSLSVEPDMPVEAAGEKEATEEIIVSKDALTVSETENPIDTLNNILSDASDSEEITVSQDGNVIALIDTGVGESANVIDRVSVIEEPETSTEHGDAMLQAIVSQNPDAKILSIRAMNSNGFGTISSLVAAMEYAISENVDMINLSLYARTTLSTSVLKSEIQKAVDAGITVIGAAGNDGVDVVDYVPGSVESAYIIGAAKEDGSRLETSTSVRR
jgi:Subtilase family.